MGVLLAGAISVAAPVPGVDTPSGESFRSTIVDGSASGASLLGGYRPTVSAFPREQPRAPLSRLALLLTAVLLGLLAAVAVHGRRSVRRAPAPATEPMPALEAWEWALLAGLTAAATVMFLVPSYLRYTSYGIESFDIGIYSHAFWNALHGHGLFNSPEGMDHLSGHASPGLYLLLPVYALAPNPFTLLCLNGLALVSGAIPAYLLARQRLGAAISLTCALIYLLNPALRSLNYDVHEVAFAVPLLLWTMMLLQYRRGGAMLVAIVLAMLFKEDVGVLVAFLGVYVAVVQRRRHLGAAVTLLGVLWVVVGIGLVVPYHGGSHGSAYMTPYNELGNGWAEILLSPLLRPAAFFGIVFSRSTLHYLIMVLAPFGFLPLLAPRELLVAIPPLAENILSSNEALRAGLYHYEALLLPALYLAFVTAVVQLSGRSVGVRPTAGASSRPVWARVVALVLGLLVLASPLLHRHFGRALLLGIDGDPARAEIDAIVARVPPDVPVVSPQHIQPHVSNRQVSAYLNNIDDFSADHPPFHYAVIPAAAKPPPVAYEIVWQGATYSLYRLRQAPQPLGPER